MADRQRIIEVIEENLRKRYAEQGRIFRRLTDQTTENKILDFLKGVGDRLPGSTRLEIVDFNMNLGAIKLAKNGIFGQEKNKANRSLGEGEELTEAELDRLKDIAEKEFNRAAFPELGDFNPEELDRELKLKREQNRHIINEKRKKAKGDADRRIKQTGEKIRSDIRQKIKQKLSDQPLGN